MSPDRGSNVSAVTVCGHVPGWVILAKYPREGATIATMWQKTLVEKQVTYTLNLNGQVILIENVPARVNEETGEQFFSPSTVERLQKTILEQAEPDYFIQVPVYNYSSSAA